MKEKAIVFIERFNKSIYLLYGFYIALILVATINQEGAEDAMVFILIPYLLALIVYGVIYGICLVSIIVDYFKSKTFADYKILLYMTLKLVIACIPLNCDGNGFATILIRLQDYYYYMHFLLN